jgi:hypothetical protein
MTETHTINELWKLACEADGISPDSKFVEFSENNYWAKKYNTAMMLYAKYQVAMRQMVSGG